MEKTTFKSELVDLGRILFSFVIAAVVFAVGLAWFVLLQAYCGMVFSFLGKPPLVEMTIGAVLSLVLGQYALHAWGMGVMILVMHIALDRKQLEQLTRTTLTARDQEIASYEDVWRWFASKLVLACLGAMALMAMFAVAIYLFVWAAETGEEAVKMVQPVFFVAGVAYGGIVMALEDALMTARRSNILRQKLSDKLAQELTKSPEVFATTNSTKPMQ